MSILAINPGEVGDLIPILDRIWEALAVGVAVKWTFGASILAIAIFGCYLVLRNQQKKKEQKNNSRAGTTSEVLQERVPPDVAAGDPHTAPTPGDDHQDSFGADQKPGVA